MRSGLLKRSNDRTEDYDLQKILRDQDPEAFLEYIEWVEINFNTCSGASAFLNKQGLTLSQAQDYMALLVKVSEFPKCKYTRFLAMCPSVLENVRAIQGVPFPAVVMDNAWGLEEMLDEYFGLVYSPRRIGTRFGPDFKKQLVNALHKREPNFKSLLDRYAVWLKDSAYEENPAPQLEDMIENASFLSEPERLRFLSRYTSDVIDLSD